MPHDNERQAVRCSCETEQPGVRRRIGQVGQDDWRSSVGAQHFLSKWRAVGNDVHSEWSGISATCAWPAHGNDQGVSEAAAMAAAAHLIYGGGLECRGAQRTTSSSRPGRPTPQVPVRRRVNYRSCVERVAASRCVHAIAGPCMESGGFARCVEQQQQR